MAVDREHILSEIRRCAAENGGRPLGRERFERETGIAESAWAGRYWARWNDAVADAGFVPNAMNEGFDVETVLDHLARCVRGLGHFPTQHELMLRRRQLPDFPSDKVFNKVGRLKEDKIAALLDFTERVPEFADVQAIVEPLAASSKDMRMGSPGAVSFGWVYLARRGRDHKIGMTRDPYQRLSTLSTQGAEQLHHVHEIKTDDPEGVERYWHSRFADRRLNGEWFRLTADDVAAFKRWKRII